MNKSTVHLHGASSNYVPVDWIKTLERELNANQSAAEAWQKVANSAVGEGDLISFLYQDSQVKRDRKPIRELRRSLEKSASLLSNLSAYLPELTSPEFMELPHLLSDLAARLAIGNRSHQDNECVMFYDSIISILVEPKILSGGSYSGLPTYNDCIEIIQAAINATDKGQGKTRETSLTAESIKKFLTRNKPKLDLYRTNF